MISVTDLRSALLPLASTRENWTMNDSTDIPRKSSGPDVPLGWAALLFGVFLLLVWAVVWVLSGLGKVPEAPPMWLFPSAVALFVSGYISCFALGRLHKRIAELERRLEVATKDDDQKTKVSDKA